jgi:ABC-2 type transport system ATP-binding protein
MGLLAPTAGSVTRTDERRAIVFLRPTMLRRSAAANIRYASAGGDRTRELLALVGLEHAAERPARRLSAGEQQRLALARALARDPTILFLDEPTASLDPDIAEKVRSALKRVQRERGVTILYTSHNMREIELVCDRVIFLSRGRVVAEGTPREILERADAESLEKVFITIARGGAIR